MSMAGWVDQTMADCILALYRSAIDVGRSGGPTSMTLPRPGLVLMPTEDPFLSVDRARAGAAQAGAGQAELPGIEPLVDASGPGQGRRDHRGVLRLATRLSSARSAGPVREPVDVSARGRIQVATRTHAGSTTASASEATLPILSPVSYGDRWVRW